MLNNISIMGRVTHTPELRYTQNQIPVCSFSIACDRNVRRNEEKKTDFFDVVAWRHTGEFVSKHFAKGDPIIVTGSLQTRQYTDRDGNKRKAVEIVANEVNFAGGKNAKSADDPADDSGSTFDEYGEIDDGELPF